MVVNEGFRMGVYECFPARIAMEIKLDDSEIVLVGRGRVWLNWRDRRDGHVVGLHECSKRANLADVTIQMRSERDEAAIGNVAEGPFHEAGSPVVNGLR